MEQNKVFEAIKKIADQNIKFEYTSKRADLAYELKDNGFNYSDDMQLSEMVYRAYIYYQKDKAILDAFITNDESQSIVKQYELNAHLDENNIGNALSVIENNLSITKNELEVAEKNIETVLQLEILKAAGSILKQLEGTQQLTEIKEKSAALMQNYGKMVNSYLAAESQVKTDIKDFVDLRGAINLTIRKYACALVDIFGDSIKVLDPNLFDFDRIKWLDVKSMQHQTELMFNQLDQNCTMLVGEVGEHFSKTLNQLPTWMNTSKALGSKNGIYGSLVMGTLSYLNHFMKAQEKSLRMEREFVKLKDSILKDRTQVKSDLFRLANIHKRLNDLYIPKAGAFLRLSEGVLSDDFEELMNEFYKSNCQELRNERDAILTRLKELERSINDHNENLSLFESQLKDWNGLLGTQKKYYEEAKSTKPEEPNFISKMFTGEKYKRRLHEWIKENGALVEAYEDMLVDVELAQESKEKHLVDIEKEKMEYNSLTRKLKEINAQIAKGISASPELKLTILKKLKDILSLLHAGKSVVESKLDESLMEIATVKEVDFSTELPYDILSKYESFCGKVVTEIKESGTNITNDLLKDLGIESESESAQKVSEVSRQAMEKLSTLLENATYLQSEQMKSKLSEEVYRRELEKLQEEFKRSMASLSDQSKILLEALQKANSASNKDDLRKALIELTGSTNIDLSEADFDAMLRGEKVIEI